MRSQLFSTNMEDVVNNAAKAYVIIHNSFGSNATALPILKKFIDNENDIAEYIANTYRTKANQSKKNQIISMEIMLQTSLMAKKDMIRQ